MKKSFLYVLAAILVFSLSFPISLTSATTLPQDTNHGSQVPLENPAVLGSSDRSIPNDGELRPYPEYLEHSQTIGFPVQEDPTELLFQEPGISPDPGAPDTGAPYWVGIDGLYYTSSQANPVFDTQGGNAPQVIQGPDQYGYTWEDAYTYNWEDMSSGIDTGISSTVRSAGPINIGFDFGYYSNTYSQLYISANGFISFDNVNLGRNQSVIPDEATPNDVIAPLWGPMDTIGYVKYATIGESPNKRMVIEWNQQSAQQGTEVYTFEIILHEKGDIVFQYQEIVRDGGWSCTSTGIEDQFGLDGLTIVDLCGEPMVETGQAFRIFRPAPAARLSMTPARQGGFVTLNGMVYQVIIRNIGDLGTDTYNIQLASGWPANLFLSDGITPLVDTDGDGLSDTGALPMGEAIELLVEITPPPGTVIGDSSDTTITATSSVDPTKNKVSTISLSVPAPFAQALYDSKLNGGLRLVHPNVQISSYPNRWTPTLGVVETANGNFVYADEVQSYDSVYKTWITQTRITILDGYGRVLKPATKLQNFIPSEISISQSNTAMAAAPNGTVGLLWHHLETAQDGKNQHNIFFAIVDESGELVYGPENITGNTSWGWYYSTENVPVYGEHEIVVTEDGNFGIAFTQTIIESGTSYDDVLFGVRDGNGNVVSPLANITRETAPASYSNRLQSVTRLNGNRYLLLWNNGSTGLMAMLINSAGGIEKPKTSLGGYWNQLDSIQLSDGKIFIAGTDVWKVYYTILDDFSLVPSTPRTMLSNPHSDFNTNVSVTKDAENHAILTWGGRVPYFLYYSLINSQGTVLTQPFIYHYSKGPVTVLSSAGHSNTTYSKEILPFTGCDAVTAIPVSECQALQAFYEQTNGAQWNNSSGWFKFSDPGFWYGVTVQQNHVVELNFIQNNLSGNIPSELSALTGLTSLILDQNNLSGTIPSSLSSLSNLEELSLGQNMLAGEIPNSLGNLASLRTLVLDMNPLTGSIPLTLANLASLQTLSLFGNQLSGAIPPSLGNLLSLTYLDLSGNPLTGSIPTELGNLSNLQYLFLNSIGLSGEIPVELSNLKELQWLYLGNNKFFGNIPPELGTLSKLVGLYLDRNQFTGSIPSELGTLTNLRYLWIVQNQLTGTIPAALGNLTNLNRLALGWNQLSGAIPPELSNLVNLSRLELQNNQLTGSIPAEIGNLTNLYHLDLSVNQLTGDVPGTIANLVNMCAIGDLGSPCWGFNGMNLGYNFLNVPAPEPPASFLAIKDPDWHLTQAVQEAIPPTGGTVISNDETTQVVIPPGAVATDTTFLFVPQPNPSEQTGVFPFVGNSFQLTALQGSTPITTFNSPLTLTIYYDPATLGPIPEDGLVLNYWDTTQQAWLDAASTCPSEYTRDLENHVLSVQICHLSEFALFGNPFEIFLPMIKR